MDLWIPGHVQHRPVEHCARGLTPGNEKVKDQTEEIELTVATGERGTGVTQCSGIESVVQ